MKKMAMLALAAGAMMAGGMAMSSGPSVDISRTEVRAAPAQAPQPVQPPAQRAAIREQRSIGDAVRAMRIPTARKNRTGGERAHRRWRKAKASGRR